MKSMTGYGRVLYQDDNISIETEIRSVNSRFIELKIGLPRELYFMEIALSKIVKKYINRGKVNVNINFTDKRTPEIELNEDRLLAYWDIYDKAKKLVATEQNISLTSLIADNDIIQAKKTNIAETGFQVLIENCLTEALISHDKMATVEGSSMLDFFEESLTLISEKVDIIETAIPPYKEEVFAKMKKNVENILSDTIFKEDYKRLLQESAIMIEKADVTEEVVRLRDHIEKFSIEMRKASVSGKALAFINQEMHREINTTGSKFSTTKVFQHILVAKEEIEKCKEMIANVR